MENTIDSILMGFHTMGEKRGVPINANQWLEGTAKLLALIGDEQDRLIDLESKIAEIRVMYMEEGDTAAKAKIKAESSPHYAQARKLKAKIERVFEAIKLGKVMARMSNDEYKSN